MTIPFLPVNGNDLKKRGWDHVDFVMVTGDAYVDHPSFGAALIARLLESKGYRVAMLAQPEWKSAMAFKEFGRPRLGFLVTSGNLDSMLSNYTASKKPRRQDAYSPGGVGGRRPDHGVIVYANRCREAYKGVPIIIGGIEASLRRFAHYDYWDNKVRSSILRDSKADLLVYGMAERQVVEIARRLSDGEDVRKLTDISGTAYLTSELDDFENYKMLPSYEDVTEDKKAYALAFLEQDREQNPFSGKTLIQPHGNRYLVQNPPPVPLNQEEMDEVYDLPFVREYHPMYDERGGVPAIQEVQFSITSHRGCYGGCSFCALTFHQGKIIQNRSKASIVNEAQLIKKMPGFKGYIHDVGGPTANFRKSACDKMERKGACKDTLCMAPEVCKKLNATHDEYLDILRTIRNLEGIKKVFIRSGIRYDYILQDKSPWFMNELCEHHVSGQLKVAPEHTSPAVLRLMGKPLIDVYDRFKDQFNKTNKKLGKEQYLVPYLMSSHPGAGLKEAIQMAETIRDWGYNPEQVQDFVPTPGSMSTVMYHTGINPRTEETVYVARKEEEKAMQRALIQFRNPANHDLVRKALKLAGRNDLIGHGPRCLVPPPGRSQNGYSGKRLKSDKKDAKVESTGRNHPPADRNGKTGKKNSKKTMQKRPSVRDRKRNPRGG